MILTYISLISGLMGIKSAYDGKIGVAICCLVVSGICDMFDGVVARSKKDRTDDEKNFGIQLDSLCDVVCFGAFPAILLYFMGVKTKLGIAFLMFYVLCAVIRLAFFNVLEMKRQMTESGCAKGYRGLPVTSSSIILPFFYLVGLIANWSGMRIVFHILPLIIGVLFIADVHVPKLDVARLLNKLFPKKHKEQEEEACFENIT